LFFSYILYIYFCVNIFLATEMNIRYCGVQRHASKGLCEGGFVYNACVKTRDISR